MYSKMLDHKGPVEIIIPLKTICNELKKMYFLDKISKINIIYLK